MENINSSEESTSNLDSSASEEQVVPLNKPGFTNRDIGMQTASTSKRVEPTNRPGSTNIQEGIRSILALELYRSGGMSRVQRIQTAVASELEALANRSGGMNSEEKIRAANALETLIMANIAGSSNGAVWIQTASGTEQVWLSDIASDTHLRFGDERTSDNVDRAHGCNSIFAVEPPMSSPSSPPPPSLSPSSPPPPSLSPSPPPTLSPSPPLSTPPPPPPPPPTAPKVAAVVPTFVGSAPSFELPDTTSSNKRVVWLEANEPQAHCSKTLNPAEMELQQAYEGLKCHEHIEKMQWGPRKSTSDRENEKVTKKKKPNPSRIMHYLDTCDYLDEMEIDIEN